MVVRFLFSLFSDFVHGDFSVLKLHSIDFLSGFLTEHWLIGEHVVVAQKKENLREKAKVEYIY